MKLWLEWAGLLGLTWGLPHLFFRCRRVWLSLCALLSLLSLFWPTLPDWLEESGAPAFLVHILSLLQIEILQGRLGTVCLFTVCLIGCFPLGHILRKRSQKLRAPLSVALGWLILPHMIRGLRIPWQEITHSPVLLFLFFNGLVSLVLLLPLWITSFHPVRRAMPVTSWIRLQKLAYALYALVFLHGALFSLGVQGSLSSALGYSSLGLLYCFWKCYTALFSGQRKRF